KVLDGGANKDTADTQAPDKSKDAGQDKSTDGTSAAAVDKVQTTDAMVAGYKTETVQKTPDAEVKQDQDGYVTETKGKDGYGRKYHYDEHGDVDRIDYTSGKRFEKNGDHWDHVDPYGNRTETGIDMKVTPNGDMVGKSSDGVTHVFHPNESS